MKLSDLRLHRLYAFPAVFLLIFTIAVFRYINKYFTDVNLQQILFIINTPMEGVDSRLLRLFIEHCLLTPILYTIPICYLPEIKFLQLKKIPLIKKSWTILISVLSLLLTLGYLFYQTDYTSIKYFFSNEKTDFYEKHFSDPKEAQINFVKKKNLVVIHVESLETTYKDKTFYGYNMLADLRDIELKGVQFSRFQNGYATDFTQGSAMALFTGMPAKYSNLVNKLGRKIHFFKGYYSLGKILKDNGYYMVAIQGSESSFGGMDVFLQDNNFDKLIDEDTIQQEYPQFSKKGSWGYTDDCILTVAKDTIMQAEDRQPYFLYVQTVDTHVSYTPEIEKFPNIENVYHNIIHHTQLHLADFLKWLQSRPNYADTVIVVIGDHLRMGNDFPMPEKRYIYNLFLNTGKPHNTDRTFTQVDMFPSVIEALGGKILNHRLGIGTSVFSLEKTFTELYSAEYLYDNLAKRNDLYEQIFLPQRK